jgi:putative SOS response-associated peptidase YedK
VCGRFTLRAPGSAIAENFGLGAAPQVAARYNIAPAQKILAVRVSEGERVAESRVWGLVPEWAAAPTIGQRLINARAETLAAKPAFRTAFRKRRCLIPADGFYEWAPGSPDKQPHHIAREDGGVFGFAGLWASWRSETGQELESCTIVTTEAHEALRRIHSRMPVVLKRDEYAEWLDPELCDAARLQPMLASRGQSGWVARAVGRRVNDVRNDDPGCLEPVPLRPQQGSLL